MEYAEIQAVNWSTLKNMGVSPLLYKYRLEHPEPRKQAFVFGGMVHTAILEPELFESRYAVFEGTRRGKAWDAWQEEHAGVESLKPHELDRVLAIAEAVRKHRIAGPLLRGGRREEPLTWTDEVTGLACKGRLDYIRPDVIVDLKSADNPAPKKFERAAADFGYAGQLAFYHDGAVRERRLDGRQMPFIIAPQKKEPFDVVVFQLEPETIEAGRALYRSLLQRLIQCTEADYFPGIAPELQKLKLPPWAAGQLIEPEDDDDAF